LLTLERLALLSRPAALFLVSSFPGTSAVEGESSFTLNARDSDNNTVASYTGTVDSSSGANQAVLPANATLTKGTKTLQAVLDTAGTQLDRVDYNPCYIY